MQSVDPFRQGLSLDRNRICDIEGRVLVRARPPHLAVRNKATPDFTTVHQWPVISDGDIGQSDALFIHRRLTDVGQIEIILGRDNAGQTDCDEGEKK